MCFQRTTTIIRVNPSKNNSTESQNLLEIPQIPPAINRISLPSQSTAPEESLAPIFVASEQGLDTSVYKRVFKPPRLKSQICFIYLQEFVCSTASKIRIYFLRKEKNPFFSYGSSFISRTSYPVSEIAAFNLSESIAWFATITVSPFL